MAAVGEGDASALSVGRRRCSGDDPFRIDDNGLIVRLVNCTNVMRDPPCSELRRADEQASASETSRRPKEFLLVCPRVARTGRADEAFLHTFVLPPVSFFAGSLPINLLGMAFLKS